MAENKDQKEITPLLMDELSAPERTFLMQIVQHAGFQVIVKLFDAACTRATQDIVRLDPEKPDYDMLLKYRTQRSRNINEFSSLVRKSINYHTSIVQMTNDEEKETTEDAVAKVFGIHKVPPKAKKVIGKQSPKGTAVNESK